MSDWVERENHSSRGRNERPAHRIGRPHPLRALAGGWGWRHRCLYRSRHRCMTMARQRSLHIVDVEWWRSGRRCERAPPSVVVCPGRRWPRIVGTGPPAGCKLSPVVRWRSCSGPLAGMGGTCPPSHGRSTRVDMSTPPVIQLANLQGESTGRRAYRSTLVHQAAPRAVTAHTTGSLSAWKTGPPQCTTRLARPTASSSARSANRAFHERTVRPGTVSTRCARDAAPRAPAAAARAAPIVSALLRRLARTNSGSTACLVRHDGQRT